MAEGETAASGEWWTRGLKAAAALAETWGSLAEVCHALVAQEWALPTDCPGWDVKDQLSHLIGIERMIMGESPPEWDGPLGDHVRTDFAGLNEKWVAVQRSRSGDEVQAEFVQVTRARLDQLHALTEEEWGLVGYSPIGQVEYARFMETRVFDCWVHEQDVRLALDRPGGVGGLASAFGIGQVEGAMGFVVGKQARAPDGAVVRFEISGDQGDARTFTVAVAGGRARPVPPGPAPTTTLGMSCLDFVRLGCGRVAAGPLEAAGRVRVDGDGHLGRHVLAAMNFMF